MAKVYSYEKFLKKLEIRHLELDLKDRVKYCEKHGNLWIDQFTLTEIKRKIVKLKEELKQME